MHSPQWEALRHCHKLLAVLSGSDAVRPSVTLLICESVLFLKRFPPCGSLRISPCHVRVAGRGTCFGFFILLENIIADDENASLASDLFLLPLL